jgi:hypothetical protein
VYVMQCLKRPSLYPWSPVDHVGGPLPCHGDCLRNGQAFQFPDFRIVVVLLLHIVYWRFAEPEKEISHIVVELLLPVFGTDRVKNICANTLTLRTEVYIYHQNQNAKNIGNFTTILKPHNIGTHLKGIETSFQVVPLFVESFHFWVSYITFCSSLCCVGP